MCNYSSHSAMYTAADKLDQNSGFNALEELSEMQEGEDEQQRVNTILEEDDIQD